jgi:ABC-type phosphate transport system ATPase subunit
MYYRFDVIKIRNLPTPYTRMRVASFLHAIYTDTFLKTINRLPFIVETLKASCKIGTDSPNVTEINFDLQRFKNVNMTFTLRSQNF